jgi:hypothetical protein
VLNYLKLIKIKVGFSGGEGINLNLTFSVIGVRRVERERE